MEIQEFLKEVFGHFFDPKKRVFIGYLLIAIVISFSWLLFIKKFTIFSSLKTIFDSKIFFSRSSKADYKVFLLNRCITMFISPLLITQLVVATFIFNILLSINWDFLSVNFNLSKISIAILFTFTVFFLDDLTKYIVHRWMHKWQILWSLHKVHHSATNLTPMTIYRTHPLEGIVFSLRAAVSQGISISVFFYFFGSSVDLLTVLGANVLIFSFNVAGSNLRHSHIGIRYWRWLEFLLISPAQHQLHHSKAREHHDKNFGATLAIWDWVFGSLHHSIETENLTLGINDYKDDNQDSLFVLYINPIREILYCLRELTVRAFIKIKEVLPGIK